MAKYLVLRAFNTPARRFRAGEVRDPGEFDGPVELEHWVELKFIEPMLTAEERQAAADRRQMATARVAAARVAAARVAAQPKPEESK